MFFLLEIIRLGLHNLRLHKLRSFLTSLGIILGVGAVILMVAIGEGTKEAALREIQALGATNIIVRSTKPPETASLGSSQMSFIISYGITRADLRRMRHFLTDAAEIVPLKAVGNEVSRLQRRVVSQSFGTTPRLVEVTSLRLARGRYISEEDLIRRRPVAVIGNHVARQFFPLDDPMGEEIFIDRKPYRVIGVLRPVGLAGGAGSALVGRDLNRDVHIPLSTAELDFGDEMVRRQSGATSGERVEVSEVFITLPTTDEVPAMAERVSRIMYVNHDEMRDVNIIVPWELLENRKRTTRAMNAMLTSIAAISLLIGGIGIMNIMLASVTERTREIGIRRALGATRRDIVAQFLVETGSLSSVGGLIGIGLGVGVSITVERALPWLINSTFLRDYFESSITFETAVTGWSIVVSFIVAAVVGLGFGIYPAVVASRQDPIVALRHD